MLTTRLSLLLSLALLALTAPTPAPAPDIITRAADYERSRSPSIPKLHLLDDLPNVHQPRVDVDLGDPEVLEKLGLPANL
ncbi:hypothetical protein DENSPDRAFT_844754 [Dentipellis sp. KUC8613]|nr:hypothetical protein DENSPDRAFT_844754 [Dentipellis sp. KUC8613]